MVCEDCLAATHLLLTLCTLLPAPFGAERFEADEMELMDEPGLSELEGDDMVGGWVGGRAIPCEIRNWWCGSR